MNSGEVRMLVFGVLVVMLMIIIGCNVQTPSTVSVGDAKDIANSLTYVKDNRTGECYAVVASRHVGDVTSNGFTLTWVPCDPKVEALIGK